MIQGSVFLQVGCLVWRCIVFLALVLHRYRGVLERGTRSAITMEIAAWSDHVISWIKEEETLWRSHWSIKKKSIRG